MATTISKSETWDIASGIATKLIVKIQASELDIRPTPEIHKQWVQEIQEELNDWISDCESEDAEEEYQTTDKSEGQVP